MNTSNLNLAGKSPNYELARHLARLNGLKQLLGGNSYEDAAYSRAIRWVLAAPRLTPENVRDILGGISTTSRRNMSTSPRRNISTPGHTDISTTSSRNITSKTKSPPGKSIRGKIIEFLETGQIAELVSLEERDDVQAASKFAGILGVGPVILRDWLAAGYTSPSEILSAHQAGKLSLTALQKAGLRYRDDLSERIPRVEVEEIASSVSHALARVADVHGPAKNKSGAAAPRMVIAGSYRRGSATSGDVDIILELPGWSLDAKQGRSLRKSTSVSPGSLKKSTSISPGRSRKSHITPKQYLASVVAELNPVEVLSLGSAKAMLLVRGRAHKIRQLDLLVAEPKEIPTMLAYFTGPAEHNESLRGRAKQLGYSLNQYGLYRGAKRIATPTEASIYETLGLKYVAPRDRM